MSKPSASPAPVLTVTLNPAIDLQMTIDAWPHGDMARASGVQRSAGGKGVNVSRVLAALGVASEAFCLVGATPDTAVFRSLLEGEPFALHAFEVEGMLRTNVTVTCAGDARQLKVNQPGPSVTPAAWRRTERALDALFADRRWVVLSGALPHGAPVEGYARLVRLARRAGAHVLLDCAGESLLAALPERPHLIKPNREELAATAGLPARSRPDALKAAHELQRRGAAWIVVSGGGAECLALDRDGYWRLTPPKIKAAGPMGAGDSMVAGILAGLLHDESFPAAVQRGVAAGAATAALPNTIFARPADVKKLLPQIAIRGPFV